MEMRTCRICNEEKEITLFETDSRKTTKKTNRCQACKNASQDKAARAYHHLRHRSPLPVEVTPAEIRLLFEVFDGKCAYCGKRPEVSRELTLDHIVPISENGRNSLANLIPVCGRDNKSKQNRPLVSYFLNNRDKFPDENMTLVIEYMALLSGSKKEAVAAELTDEHISYELKQKVKAIEKEARTT
ncbi:HNH endonuclease [Neobacillus drentensis]|uniref:HNH endonuclease signature motif containing protein n=1 Tax=Neobacillus drentensis TaxID=220684 RepID=UPI002FFF7939